MLSKKIRLTTSLFDQVFKNGRVQHSERFWMRSFLLPTVLPSRFAVAVPKKVAKTAVLRNKIKRMVYSAIETSLKNPDFELISGNMVIFGVKKDITSIPIEEIANEIRGLKKGQK